MLTVLYPNLTGLKTEEAQNEHPMTKGTKFHFSL